MWGVSKQKDHFYWPNHPFRTRNWSTSPRVTCSNFLMRSINIWDWCKPWLWTEQNCNSSTKEKKTWHHGSLVFTRVSASARHCSVRYQSDLIAFSASFRCSKIHLTAISSNFSVIVCLDPIFMDLMRWDHKHSYHCIGIYVFWSFSLNSLLVTVSEYNQQWSW